MEENLPKFVTYNFKFKLSVFAFLLPFLFIAIRYWHDEVFHLYKPMGSLKILKYNLPYLFYFFYQKFSHLFLF